MPAQCAFAATLQQRILGYGPVCHQQRRLCRKCNSNMGQIQCKQDGQQRRATSRHSAAQVARMVSARSTSTRRCSTSPDSAYVSTDLGTGGTKRSGNTCTRCCYLAGPALAKPYLSSCTMCDGSAQKLGLQRVMHCSVHTGKKTHVTYALQAQVFTDTPQGAL